MSNDIYKGLVVEGNKVVRCDYIELDEDDDEYDDYDDDMDDDSGYDEVICPACGETICVDESLDLEDVVCPACGESLGDIDVCDGNCSGCSEDCENK